MLAASHGDGLGSAVDPEQLLVYGWKPELGELDTSAARLLPSALPVVKA